MRRRERAEARVSSQIKARVVDKGGRFKGRVETRKGYHWYGHDWSSGEARLGSKYFQSKVVQDSLQSKNGDAEMSSTAIDRYQVSVETWITAVAFLCGIASSRSPYHHLHEASMSSLSFQTWTQWRPQKVELRQLGLV